MCFGQTQVQDQSPDVTNPDTAFGPRFEKQFKPNKFGSFAQGMAGGYNETPGFAPTTKMGKLGAIIGAMTRGGFDAWGPGDIGTGFQRAEEKSMNRDYYRQQMQRQKIADQMREQQLGVQQGRLDVSREGMYNQDILRRAQAALAMSKVNAPAKRTLLTGADNPMAGNYVDEQGNMQPALVDPETTGQLPSLESVLANQPGLPPELRGFLPSPDISTKTPSTPRLSLPSFYQSERDKKAQTSKPIQTTTADETGASSSRFVEGNRLNPSFGKPISPAIGSRAAKPDKAAAKTAQEETFANAAERLVQGFGGDAARAEQALRSDKSVSATNKEGIIRHIRKTAPRGKQSDRVNKLRQEAGLPPA